MDQSPLSPTPGGQSQRINNFPRKYKWWHASSVASELSAYICLFLAWSGNGRHRTYIDLDGYRVGGLGYCWYDDCRPHLNSKIPVEFAHSMKGGIAPWVFQGVLWAYLSLACIGSALFLGFCFYWLFCRDGRYHKVRFLQLSIITSAYFLPWACSMICALITDVELGAGYVLSIAPLVLLVFSTLVQIRIFFYYRSQNKHQSGDSLVGNSSGRWSDTLTSIADFLGSLLGSQFWSCLAALFYIGVNVVIMIHDFRTEAVQIYIKKEITYKYAGVEEYQDAHPVNFGPNATCSHFPTSNISTQGSGIASIGLFFVYHIGLCFIAILLMVDELFDIRFGILGPQRNKTGAAWTSFYLFTATMSRSIVFWSRAYIQTITAVAWAFLGIAGLHLLSHHTKIRQWSRSKRPLGITHYDRHARIRTGREDYRGPLQIPLVYRLQFFEGVQRRIGEGDPDMRTCALKERNERGETVAMEWAMGTDRSGNFMKIAPNIDDKLGMASDDPHSLSTGVGIVKHMPEYCAACNAHACNISRLVFFRGYPVHRGGGYVTWTALMDFRRLSCVICGFLLFLIHFTLCFNELSLSARWKFQTEYVDKRKTWAADKGADLNNVSPLQVSECAYFDYSSIPIAYYGKNDLNASVLLTVAIVGLNKAFLMGMCISVMMVSLMNNRYWGQNVVLGVFSLIGPRLSSISVGLTLIHVSISTLSQSLFADRESYCVSISRGICYTALVVGMLSCVFTEDLSGKRDGLTSESAWFKTLFRRKKNRPKDVNKLTEKEMMAEIAEKEG